ncbi:hypothetical protein [Micromonospora costi]|nr:hypothetical protein [Micromonospora costi]
MHLGELPVGVWCWQSQEVFGVAVALLPGEPDRGAFERRVTNERNGRA